MYGAWDDFLARCRHRPLFSLDASKKVKSVQICSRNIVNTTHYILLHPITSFSAQVTASNAVFYFTVLYSNCSQPEKPSNVAGMHENGLTI